LEIQGNTIKDTVFYSDEIPHKFNLNIWQKWIGHTKI